MAKRYKGYVKFNNKKYWASGSSKLELEKNKAKLLVKLENNLITYTSSMLYSDWAKDWVANYKQNVSVTYRKNIEMYLNNVIFPIIGNISLKDIKPIHIQRIFNSIADKSSSYNKKVYLILTESLREAQNNELLANDIMKSFKPPKGKGKGQRRALTEKESTVVLKVAETHRAGLFILIMYYCGLRPQEVAALIWKDIDLINGYIDVNKAIKRDGTVGSTKTKAGVRQVPIPDTLLFRLKTEKKSPFDLVCTNTEGNIYMSSSIQTLWRSFKREMNVEMGCKIFRNQLVPPLPVAEDLTLYCLRHNYCTNLEKAGVPINVAKNLMGHEDISTTAKIYTHTGREALENAKKLLNNAI